ncbi:MAG TPA: DUF4199 domain-containing protein [Flavobacteriaceae bacterium]|nr:DUF4199 domain-containing protein [Flavobacteriaceae bacterium]
MKKYTISIKFGVFTGIILILYFLVLGWLEINSNPLYSLANALITASGLSLAIRELKEKTSGRITYQRGFEVAFISGIIATVLFSIFFITYYVYVPDFAEDLLKTIGDYASTGSVFLTVVTMGVLTSGVVAFALMQLHKTKVHENPKQDKESFFIKEKKENKRK